MRLRLALRGGSRAEEDGGTQRDYEAVGREQMICAGCKLDYPDRMLDRIQFVTRSRICPLCAEYILKDIHGQGFAFKGDVNQLNKREALQIAGGKWKPPTEVA